jgi:ATP-dependent DNA helicase RecQ
MARNLVSVDFEHFNTLQLTEKSRPILRGEERLMLRLETRPAKAPRAAKVVKKTQLTEDLKSRFWEALRAKRRELAENQGIAPYMIFHDATLMAMLEYKPRSLADMGEISGIGERKLQAYGDDFLKIVQTFTLLGDDTMSSSALSIRLFTLGHDITSLASIRQLQETTIYAHLADGIAQNELALNDVIDIPDTDMQTIKTAIENLPDEYKNSVKLVYEALNEKYSYGVLRCVRAALSRF